MNKIIQLRTADEMSDLVGANLRAKSEVTPIPCTVWPSPAGYLCKTPGIKKEYALVELRNWGEHNRMACAAAGALAQWWDVVLVGNEMRGDQAGTMELLELEDKPHILCIMARSEPDKVLESMRATRRSKSVSNWEVETFLTDMTKARLALEPRGIEMLRCEVSQAATTLQGVLKNGR